MWKKMLQLIDVHTYYGDSQILQGVTFEVAESSIVALLGRNGMGKTTTMRSIVGFTPPRRGIVRFKGTDISDVEPHKIIQMGIGLVPQGRRIFSSLSVKENLIIATHARPDVRKDWDIDRVIALFPQLGARLSAQGNAISGGELQMLAIARALMGNPDLLLMDEPSEGLAPIIVKHIENIIKQLKDEGDFSILLAEQSFHLALEVADYVYIISKGTIVYESVPRQLRDNEEVKVKHLGV
jgi:branched-chain amino acid transport system ATP-binding protein